MKILILAESLRINDTSSGIVISNFINALVQGQNEVFVIYEDKLKYDLSWLPIKKFTKIKYYKNKYLIDYIPKIRALPAIFTGFPLNFYRQIKLWQVNISKEIKKNKYDLVITLGSGQEFAPHLAMLNIKQHPNWLAYFHDPFPGILYPEPYKMKENRQQRVLRDKAKRIINKSNTVGFPSLRLKEWMAQFFPEINEKYVILPHVYTELKNLPELDSDKDFNIDTSKCNFVHLGTLLGPRTPEPLLEGFKLFNRNNPDAIENSVLYIIGKVNKKHAENISQAQDGNIFVASKRVSYAKSIEILNQSFCNVIIEADAEHSPFMPGKLTNYIQANKLILALTPKTSETKRLLGDDYKYITENNNPPAIAALLADIYAIWKQEKETQLNRPDLVEYISPDNLNKAIRNLIQ